MDTSLELAEGDASGWKRGVYLDVKRTFRAPVVNRVWRCLMANNPTFTRYAWGQIKPAFDTHAFAAYAEELRDAVLSPLEEEFELPAYRAGDVGMTPERFDDCRQQLATFDAVAPRLGLLFALVDRSMNDGTVGSNPPDEESATAPFPPSRDGLRGKPPDLVPVDRLPERLEGPLRSVRDFHDLGSGTPSIYRCLAQWPAFFDSLWSDVEPIAASEAFDRSVESVQERVHRAVDETPYTPRLSAEDLRGIGMTDAEIDGIRNYFRAAADGPIRSIVPALFVYATAVGAGGPRSAP